VQRYEKLNFINACMTIFACGPCESFREMAECCNKFLFFNIQVDLEKEKTITYHHGSFSLEAQQPTTISISRTDDGIVLRQDKN